MYEHRLHQCNEAVGPSCIQHWNWAGQKSPCWCRTKHSHEELSCLGQKLGYCGDLFCSPHPFPRPKLHPSCPLLSPKHHLPTSVPVFPTPLPPNIAFTWPSRQWDGYGTCRMVQAFQLVLLTRHMSKSILQHFYGTQCECYSSIGSGCNSPILSCQQPKAAAVTKWQPQHPMKIE